MESRMPSYERNERALSVSSRFIDIPAYLALARFNRRASSLIGSLLLAASLIASAWFPPARSSSYS